MALTPEGMVRLVRALQPLNAALPMMVTPSGMETLVRPLQSLNAWAKMLVTLEGVETAMDDWYARLPLYPCPFVEGLSDWYNDWLAHPEDGPYWWQFNIEKFHDQIETPMYHLGGRKEYGWKLKLGEIARIWRGGCIIRARFLQKIADAYRRDPKLANLLLDPYFRRKVHAAQANWRKVVVLAAQAGLPAPAFMSALAYYDSYRAARLPANLLQAQRDYFGAHSYERLDQPRGRRFHLDWPEPGRPQIKLS